MLWSTAHLSSLEPIAEDGAIGRLRDIYFDDRRWVIRYLVVDTGGWLGGRDVLIAPHAVKPLDPDSSRLMLQLTKRQIEEAPGIETDKPVSRQMETAYYNHYGYPYYWAGTDLWGSAALPLAGMVPLADVTDPALMREDAERSAAQEEPGDPHLRSGREVIGYQVEARDGDIGPIDDLLFDGRNWQIRYAVIDTRNWLPGGQVVIPANRLEAIRYDARTARVTMSRAAVEASPPYHRDQAASDTYFERVQRHFETSL